MILSTPSSSTSGIGILLTGQPAAAKNDAELGMPAILLPLHQRSLLQRAVEHLVRSGCRHIHIALGDEAAPVKDFLHTGERWGCRISYHYLDPQESLGRFVRRLDLTPEHRYWLADATQVPQESLPAMAAPATAGQPLCWNDGTRQRWSGWGLYSGSFLTACEEVPAHESLEQLMLNSAELLPHPIGQPLAAATLADLLDASRRLLATQSEPVLIGRGSQIHPEAKIIAPVFIGAHVKIGASTVIGPNVAIEAGAFIDDGAHLHNSIVLPDTYVGKELDLHGIIVHGSLLANISLNIVTEISDSNLLAELDRDSRTPAHRLLAGALRLTLAPLYWMSRWQIRRQPAGGEQPVTIPHPRGGQSEPGRVYVNLTLPEALSGNMRHRLAEHFCRTFYPGLREVVRGRLQLAGPTLRSLGAVRRLSPEWRRLYGEYRCGLLNEALLQNMAASSRDDQFASDVLACAGQGELRPTWKLLSSYLGQVLRELRGTCVARPKHPIAAAPFGEADETPATHHQPI